MLFRGVFSADDRCIFFSLRIFRYLKEFRVDQCPLFLQHKCTAHRPFTCFNWHFMNQRRRRPRKKRDGTFNYSPDVYCSQYDETTGICPSADECVLNLSCKLYFCRLLCFISAGVLFVLCTVDPPLIYRPFGFQLPVFTSCSR